MVARHQVSQNGHFFSCEDLCEKIELARRASRLPGDSAAQHNTTHNTIHRIHTMSQRIVSDVEFEASMNWVMVEHNSRSYFWDWHRADPHLTVYDMYRLMDEQREAQALEEWEDHVAEEMDLYRQAIADAAEEADAEADAEAPDAEEAEAPVASCPYREPGLV